MFRATLPLLVLVSVSTAFAAEFYVAPTGSDNDSGTQAAPLATLEGARDAIRAFKAKGLPPEPIRVIVADGHYALNEAIVLESQDSGTAQAPITYETAPGATPVFSGGRAITGWKQGPGGIWTTKVDEVAAGDWYFEQLFVNGRRATRARTPNEFYLYIQDVHEDVIEAGSPRQHKQARQTVVMRPEDFPILAEFSPEELHDVNFMVYHKWDNTRRFVDRLDTEQQALVTSGRGMKSWNAWTRNTCSPSETRSRSTTSTTSVGVCSATWGASTPSARRKAPRL